MTDFENVQGVDPEHEPMILIPQRLYDGMLEENARLRALLGEVVSSASANVNAGDQGDSPDTIDTAYFGGEFSRENDTQDQADLERSRIHDLLDPVHDMLRPYRERIAGAIAGYNPLDTRKNRPIDLPPGMTDEEYAKFGKKHAQHIKWEDGGASFTISLLRLKGRGDVPHSFTVQKNEYGQPVPHEETPAIRTTVSVAFDPTGDEQSLLLTRNISTALRNVNEFTFLNLADPPRITRTEGENYSSNYRAYTFNPVQNLFIEEKGRSKPQEPEEFLREAKRAIDEIPGVVVTESIV